MASSNEKPGKNFFASLPLYIEASGRVGFNDALNGLYKRGHIHEGKIYYSQLYTPYTIRWNSKKKRWFFDWRGLCKDDVASACVADDVASPHLATKTWLVFDGTAWVKDPLIKVQAVEDVVTPKPPQAHPGADYPSAHQSVKRGPESPVKKRPKNRKKSKTSKLMSSLYEKVFLVDSNPSKKDKKRMPEKDGSENSPTFSSEGSGGGSALPKSPRNPSETFNSLGSVSESEACSDKEMQWIVKNMKKEAKRASETSGSRSLSHRSNLIALDRHRRKSIDLRQRENRLKRLEEELMAEKAKLTAQKASLETQVLGFAKSQGTAMLNREMGLKDDWQQQIEAEKKSIEAEQQEEITWREKYESLINMLEEQDDESNEVLNSHGITDHDIQRWTATDLFSEELMGGGTGTLPPKTDHADLFDDHSEINTKLLTKIRSMNSQLDLNPFLYEHDFASDDEFQGSDAEMEARTKEWQKNPLNDLFNKADFGAAKIESPAITSPSEALSDPPDHICDEPVGGELH